MIRHSINKSKDPAALEKKWADYAPLKRLGAPAEIAQAVLYLASSDAGFRYWCRTGDRWWHDGWPAVRRPRSSPGSPLKNCSGALRAPRVLGFLPTDTSSGDPPSI